METLKNYFKLKIQKFRTVIFELFEHPEISQLTVFFLTFAAIIDVYETNKYYFYSKFMRKYLVLRRKMPFLFLKDTLVDFYAMLFQRRKKHVDAQIPPRILLISFGHLGDALILSYIFPEILRTYPNAKIDVLAGDWCDAIWKNNPYIQRVIHLNHYGTNRKNEGFLAKIGNHFQTTRQAIAELRTKTYDYSIDIRFSGEISHWILPFIKVQKSVGFGTVGFGGLLDKEFFFLKTNLTRMI